jgi:hypothetical protein
MEKKNIGKIQVCIDFHNLNNATPKDEYPMPIDDTTNICLGQGPISCNDP